MPCRVVDSYSRANPLGNVVSLTEQNTAFNKTPFARSPTFDANHSFSFTTNEPGEEGEEILLGLD